MSLGGVSHWPGAVVVAIAVLITLGAAVGGSPVQQEAVADSSVAVVGNVAIGSQHTTTSDFEAGTLTNLTASDGNVTFDDSERTGGTTADWGALNQGTVSGSTKRGVRITANADMAGLNVTIDKDSSGYTHLYVHRWSDGTLIADKAISETSGDTTVSIDVSLSSGSSYYVVVDDGGGTWNSAYDDTGSPPASASSSDIDIDGGVNDIDGNLDPSRAQAIRSVQAVFGEPKPETGTYISTPHQVSNAAKAAVNITTLENATATVTITDADTGKVLNQSTVASTGNHTFKLSAQDSSNITTNVTVTKQPGTGEHRFVLADESILYASSVPSVDNNTASPSGEQFVDTSPVTLEVDITDSDFSTEQSDSLEVEWYLDGSLEKTTTVTSNGTASTTVVPSTGGNHTWRVEITDEAGNSVSSGTFTFRSPGNLEIRNESKPSQLVTGVNVTITFYFENEPNLIVTRNSSDGTVNMTGLPIDKPFTVVAEAPGYRNRRIFVESLLETQSVYLLNNSQPHVDVRFKLEDYTGEFRSAETVLLVQRALNGSWETVEGDFFGATEEFPAQLRTNARHRLVLLNTETGKRQPVGTFTPLASGEQVVRVLESGEIELRRPVALVTFSPGVTSLPASDGVTVGSTVDNQTNSLEWWNVTVIYRDSSGNTTLSTINKSGPAGGSFSPSVNLTGRAGGNVTVITSWKTSDGQTGSSTEVYQVRQTYQNQYSLLGVALNVPTLLPGTTAGQFTTMVAVVLTVILTTMVGQATRASTEVYGLVALMPLTVFALIGWVGYDLLFVACMSWVVVAGIRRGL